MVLVHPFVIGELALGNLVQRELVLGALSDLPRAGVATDAEALDLIDQHVLFGRGIRYVDAHLLAAVSLTAGAALWTYDKPPRGLPFTLVWRRRAPSFSQRPAAPAAFPGGGARGRGARG